MNDGPFRWLDRIGTNTTSYSDRSVQPNTKYGYRIRAIIFQVETSDYSTAVSITTTDDNPVETAPEAPSNLVASDVTSSSVTLAWRDNADDETAFMVERSLNGRDFSLLVELSSDSMSYQDQSVAPATSYFYRVKAKKGDLESAYSNIAEILSDAMLPPLATPTGLMAQSTPSGSIKLNWNDVSSAETHFEIQRSIDAGPFRWLARLPANTTRYTDQGVSDGVKYSYRIRAIDFQVNATDYSNAVSVVAQRSRLNGMSAVTMMLLDK